MKHHEVEPLPRDDVDEKVTLVHTGKVFSLTTSEEEPKQKEDREMKTERNIEPEARKGRVERSGTEQKESVL